ncbi:MAG: non-heme iron oxygenase ferredoxin subunit [Pseudomonadota bacterium]
MSDLIAVMPLASVEEGELYGGTVAGAPVLLCQVEGRLYAMADRCSHTEQRLSRGRLRGHEVRCPLHGARFDVRTGAPLCAPATAPVRTYPVLVEAGKVCVALE